MDIIGLKFAYLFPVYGAIVLTTVSFQYFCLGKRMDFIIALLGLLGILLFGLCSTLYSLLATPLMKLWSQAALGLLIGSLSSLLIFHLGSSRSRKKQHALLKLPLLVALLAVIIYQSLGGGATQLFFISLILITVFFSFRKASEFRLVLRFYYFFSLLFTLGSLCFFISRRFFIVDFLEGLLVFLSFIFAYQTMMVLMATSFIDLKLGEGH